MRHERKRHANDRITLKSRDVEIEKNIGASIPNDWRSSIVSLPGEKPGSRSGKRWSASRGNIFFMDFRRCRDRGRWKRWGKRASNKKFIKKGKKEFKKL